MKKLKSNSVLLINILFLLLATVACDEENSLLVSDTNAEADQVALEKIIYDDESLQSFDINYNEENIMDFVLGKTAEEIYPVKTGQRMKLVERNLNIIFEGELAYGVLTKTFEGVLFIAATPELFGGNFENLDLNEYEKAFKTVITRNIIFEKIDNLDNPLKNWKITQISLPEGGTLQRNIEIQEISIYLPNGETFIIDSPLDYYLSRGISFGTLIPVITQPDEVSIKVKVKSAYAEADFVTLTHGAIRSRLDKRIKTRLEMTEQTDDGIYYYRTYEGGWTVHQLPGFRHAVINAFPYGVFKDSEAPVESNSWGIPYMVN